MKWLMGVLRRLGLLPHFTVDEVINAEIENTLREYNKVVEDVKRVSQRRRTGNAKLRQALVEARIRSAPLAQFEHAIKEVNRAPN